MAIYHCSIKVVSRGSGKSAVAAAAYRAGEKITNEYDGITHDYTKKSGIIHTNILLPDNAPPEYEDRAVLWNAVEKIEKAKNSQLAREIELALPVEFSELENRALVRSYVKKQFVDKGMCADICIHDKKDGNPHAHILLTMRPFNEDGTWGTKQKKGYILDDNGEKIYDPKKKQYKCKSIQSTDWNEQTKAEEWREEWAKAVNALMERQGKETRIDHRSYERQGIDEVPTIHLGVAAMQMERRGIRTRRGNKNREIKFTNQQLRQLKARINKLENWLKEESKNTEPPTLADVISEILNVGDNKTHWQRIDDLKSAARILNFLTSHKVIDIADLQQKVSSMYDNISDIQDKFKPIERRLKVLNKHIEQREIYFKHKKCYEVYKQQKSKKQQSFYDNHRTEIVLFEAARKYLKEHLNGRELIPIKSWKEEQKRLSAEQQILYKKYGKIKEETREAESIQRSVKRILQEHTQRNVKQISQEHISSKKARSKGMEI